MGGGEKGEFVRVLVVRGEERRGEERERVVVRSNTCV